jgi:hypothetical protein
MVGIAGAAILFTIITAIVSAIGGSKATVYFLLVVLLGILVVNGDEIKILLNLFSQEGSAQ